MCWQFPLLGIVVDFGHYFVHRAMHSKFWYEHIHYVHHSLNDGGPLTAYYSHPLDFLLGITAPVVLGWWTIHGDLKAFLVYVFLAQVGALYIHSGQSWLGNKWHYQHHAKLKRVYGLFGISDFCLK
ncbi:hypothetical protein ASPZODRAFT_132391 [Penicilliopsis zonata CBS 506.65]|uniref:Fatty acid hydroxylase domain-containing protein n=1 Tax=Penicilliopsis zonata CBS 506.65 TaxID=1073090 RepID=A0A1L9SK30_9EURO|nr:hypothetical protein ASPZODRAFT_132391 [Penicilliopsis zonata CBS 506.65]OJJ47414.1 hypothetical protein ASPZODRAFT_132391 [Penicilliopsis zonata CBS 506.65]